jgi:hypothetical protein
MGKIMMPAIDSFLATWSPRVLSILALPAQIKWLAGALTMILLPAIRESVSP